MEFFNVETILLEYRINTQIWLANINHSTANVNVLAKIDWLNSKTGWIIANGWLLFYFLHYCILIR